MSRMPSLGFGQVNNRVFEQESAKDITNRVYRLQEQIRELKKLVKQ